MLRNTALRSTTPLLRTPVLRASYSVVGPRKMLITPSECTESTLFLDASWHMPNLSPPRHAAAEHASLRIPGSQFWSVDEIAESSPLGLSHMLPSPQRLAEALGKMGIEKGREIVVYDSVGVFSSPRTAFTFAAYGIDVKVLDGGLSRWIAEGYPVHTTEPTTAPKPTSYPVPTPSDSIAIKSYDDIVRNSTLSNSKEIVLDSRPAARFHGVSDEPRTGLSSGHIPHSLSLPFTSLLSSPSTTTPSYKTLLPRSELEQVFIATLGEERWRRVLSGEESVIASCGSGMTAGITWLALRECGVKDRVGLFDESWTGYSSREGSVIQKS